MPVGFESGEKEMLLDACETFLRVPRKHGKGFGVVRGVFFLCAIARREQNGRTYFFASVGDFFVTKTEWLDPLPLSPPPPLHVQMIKRLCRKLGMPRWPFRQIDSINKAMEDLQDQLDGARTEADRARCACLAVISVVVWWSSGRKRRWSFSVNFLWLADETEGGSTA